MSYILIAITTGTWKSLLASSICCAMYWHCTIRTSLLSFVSLRFAQQTHTGLRMKSFLHGCKNTICATSSVRHRSMNCMPRSSGPIQLFSSSDWLLNSWNISRRYAISTPGDEAHTHTYTQVRWNDKME